MQETVIEIFEDVLGTDEIREDLDLNLFETELLDSLAMIEVLLEIENRLGIELQPTDLDLLALRIHPRSALPDLEASLTVLHSSSEPGGSAGAPRAPTWCSSNTHSSAFLSSLSGRPGPWATRPP